MAKQTMIGKLGKFRCLYCKRRLRELALIAAHEMSCPLKAAVEYQWTYARERALTAEARATIKPAPAFISSGVTSLAAHRQPSK